ARTVGQLLLAPGCARDDSVEPDPEADLLAHRARRRAAGARSGGNARKAAGDRARAARRRPLGCNRFAALRRQAGLGPILRAARLGARDGRGARARYQGVARGPGGHSSFAPERRMISAHFAESARRKAANASGAIVRGSMPRLAIRFAASGRASATAARAAR